METMRAGLCISRKTSDCDVGKVFESEENEESCFNRWSSVDLRN